MSPWRAKINSSHMLFARCHKNHDIEEKLIEFLRISNPGTLSCENVESALEIEQIQCAN